MRDEHHYGRLFLTGVLTLVGIVALLGVVIMVFGKKTPTSPAQLEVTREAVNDVEEVITGGTLSLEASTTRVNAGDTVTVFVNADSKKTAIVGYDVAFSKPEGFEFISAESALEEFTIRSDVLEDQIIITGTTSLNSEGTTFSQTRLITATFKAVSRGQHDLELIYVKDATNDSNMHDAMNKDILQKVTGLTFVIE